MKNNFLKEQKGSLLLEALLAVVVLSVSVTLVVQSMTSSLRAVVYSADYTKALFLIENRMFDVLQKEFIQSGVTEQRDFTQPYEEFSYELKTKKSDILQQENINELALSVKWKVKNNERSIKIETYLFDVKEE